MGLGERPGDLEAVMIALLPKKEGAGVRPIGLFPGLYRLWAAGRLRLTRRPSLDQLCDERAGRCRI